MKTWLLAAGIPVALALSAGASFAGGYCHDWGGNAVRCLASNGIAPGHPFGQPTRAYFFELSVKPEFQPMEYKIVLDVWSSLCGISGAHISRTSFTRTRSTSLLASYSPQVHSLMCLEYFADHCEAPIGTPRSCQDVVSMHIR